MTTTPHDRPLELDLDPATERQQGVKSATEMYNDIASKPAKPIRRLITHGDSNEQQREKVNARMERERSQLRALDDVVTDVMRTVTNEMRLDFDIALSESYIRPDGKLSFAEGAVELTDHSFNQLAKLAPREAPVKLNVNSWLAGSRKRARVRSLYGTSDERSAFAVVSERYIPHDLDELAPMFAQQLGGNRPSSFRYDGNGGRWQIASKLRFQFEALGEPHDIELILRSSDDGRCSQSLDLRMVRLICSNGLRVVDRNVLRRVRHVGDPTRIASQLGDMIELIADVADRFGELWTTANHYSFTSRFGDRMSAREAIFSLAMNKSIAVPHVKPIDLAALGLQAWEREPGDSVASVINAFTRVAHENDSWKSQWYQDDIEEQAGELLYQHVGQWRAPSLSDEQRHLFDALS